MLSGSSTLHAVFLLVSKRDAEGEAFFAAAAAAAEKHDSLSPQAVEECR